MSPLSPRRLRSGPVSAPQEAFHEHEHKDISGDSPVVPRRLRLPVFFREKPGDAKAGPDADTGTDPGPVGPAAGRRPGGRAGRSGTEDARGEGRSGSPGHPGRDPAVHGGLQHQRRCPEVLQAQGVQGHSRGEQPPDRDDPGPGRVGTAPGDWIYGLEREPGRRHPVRGRQERPRPDKGWQARQACFQPCLPRPVPRGKSLHLQPRTLCLRSRGAVPEQHEHRPQPESLHEVVRGGGQEGHRRGRRHRAGQGLYGARSGTEAGEKGIRTRCPLGRRSRTSSSSAP